MSTGLHCQPDWQPLGSASRLLTVSESLRSVTPGKIGLIRGVHLNLRWLGPTLPAEDSSETRLPARFRRSHRRSSGIVGSIHEPLPVEVLQPVRDRRQYSGPVRIAQPC